MHNKHRGSKQKLTRHHILPKSIGWTNHFNNLEKKKDVKHRAHHILYDNNAPHQQLQEIIDLTGKAFNKCFTDDITDLIENYEIDEIYNERCVQIDKLVRHILDTKN